MKTFITLCIVVGFAAGCGEVVPSTSVGLDAAPTPTVTSIDPDHGGVAGGIEVTVTGTGFGADEDAVVVVNGVQAASATVVSDSVITFTLPPSAEDGITVDVTVSTQHGFATLEDAFRYNVRPRLVSIAPAIGRMSGGTTVTITGRGFVEDEAGIPSVIVAGAALSNVQIVNDETVTGDLTAAPAGVKPFTPVDVVLSNANGDASLAGAIKLSKQGLIGVERQAFGIWYIDPTDGYAVKIATSPLQVKACVTTASGTIFATRRRSPDNQFELGTFEPITGGFTSIGLLNAAAVNHQIGNLAFAGATLYGGVGGNATAGKAFYSINTTTGALTQIGAAMTTLAHTTIATRDASTLWIVDRIDQTLDTINVSTSAVTPGAAIVGPVGLTTTLMSMASAGGTLYGVDRNVPSRLFSINTTTATFTLIPSPDLTVWIHSICQTPPSF